MRTRRSHPHTLAESAIGTIRSIARRKEYKYKLQFGELLGAAWEGALDAAKSYDPSIGSFEAHASKRINGAIIDYLRSTDIFTRRMREQIKLGELDDIRQISMNNVMVDPETGQETEYSTLFDSYVPGPYDVVASKDEVEHILGMCRNMPSGRKRVMPVREIIKLYYIDGLTLAEVGKKVGASEHCVFKVIAKTLKDLRERMTVASK